MGKFYLLALACVPVVAFARPDRNAYLNTSVGSVSGLIAEVKHDPAVADRYERHFGMTKEELITMFSQLHIARLKSDLPVTMYSVPAGGAIKMHRSVMKKGTPVFEDASGTVVLKVKCGNPVVPGTPLTEVGIPSDAAIPAAVIRNLAPDMVTRPDSNDAIAAILEPTTPPDTTVVEVTPPKQDVINNITNTTTNTTYTTTSNANAGALWAAVPIGAFIGVLATNHHGCCCSNPTPAPEPMSMTMLAVGVSGLALKRRKRQG